jgi:hypothetical protein
MLPLLGCIIGVVNLIDGSLKIFIKKYPNKKPRDKTKKAETKISKKIFIVKFALVMES